MTINPHGKSEMEQLESGVEKFILVLEGTVQAKIDRKEYTLNKEDSIYFDATLLHQLSNPGPKQARVFAAVSPSKI